MKDANGGVAATAWLSAAVVEGNKVTFTFEMNAAVTKTGTYTFEIPAGVIKSVDGEEFAGQTFTFNVEEPVVDGPLVPTDINTGYNDYNFSQIKLTFDENITVEDCEVYATVYNENGEEVLVFDKKNTGYGTTSKFVTFSSKTYGAMVETPGTYKIVVTAKITGESGRICQNFEYERVVTKAPVEIYKEYEDWSATYTDEDFIPVETAIEINNAEEISIDQSKKVTMTVGETVYEAETFLEGNIISMYFNIVEFVEGTYTLTIPAGFYTYDGIANEEEVRTFTYAKPAPITVVSITPAPGVVESIEAIEVTLSDPETVVYQAMLTDNNGNEYFLMNIAETGIKLVPVDMMTYEAAIITEPGTYTLDLSELANISGETKFTWTIEEKAPSLNETVIFDFTNNAWAIPTMAETNYSGVKTANEYTDGTKSIKIDPTANGGNFYYDNGFLRIAKPGSKITLPTFDFAVEKIEVVGHSSGTSYANVDMNVYVGEDAVSTACIGTAATSTFEITAENQAAGNVYELVIGSNGGNYSSIMYITYIKVYPADNKLEAPEFDLASGVYVGTQTVNVHSATADLEGVTNVTYYYTTNGNEPTVEDEEAVDGVITVENSCTVKAIVELTYGDKVYVSASSAVEFIISEEVTYHRAVAVESGSYFIAANGNVAAPLANNVLPAVETTINGNDLTEAAYYAITLEETAEGGTYYIKDVNGNYIYTSSMYGTSGPKLSSNGTHTPMSSWTITIAEDENSTATIVSEGLTLVYDTVAGVFKVTESVSDEMVLPTLYGTQATCIENVITNGEAIESIYDLNGRKIEEITQPGIYIVNGKKVFVK